MSRIFLSKADVTDVEEAFVLDALRSGWVAPLGPHVDAFEAEVAERVGVGHALALASGTAALHLALLHAGARPGTTVVVSTMTFAASANAVAYTGAEPVFVDCDEADANVDASLLIEAVDTLLSEGTEVAAVMVVDLFGRCADYDRIVSGLEARGIPLIEDAAEALGARTGSGAAGSFGMAGVLSFNGNKIMTTSGGGMLLSDDEDVISRARYLSTQARQPVAWYEHTEIGYNYRMSNLLAALGRGQLTRLDDMIERRRQIRKAYVSALGGIDGLSFLVEDAIGADGRADNAWLTCITLDPKLPAPDFVIGHLAAADIEARHLWKPMHAQPLFAGARAFVNGTAERLFARGLTLPSGSTLSDSDVERVIVAVCDALNTSDV
jgi:dTDP-4-amino-4,6-dideoxygalactose transaminase